MSELEGRRVLVVGASAGIGRAIALACARAGADIAVTARRQEKLDDLLAEAGGGTAIACDVAEPGACGRMVAAAHEALGSLDVVVYAAGSAPLRPLLDATDDDWHAAFATNVIGANQVTQAAVPLLSPGGIILVLSSETVGRPRHALGIYGASKAALEESMRAWRLEHPGTRFTTVAVGATQPTEFGDAFDAEVLIPALDAWSHHGLMQQEFMETDHVAALLVGTLVHGLAYPGVALEHVLLRSPSAVIGMAEFMASTVADRAADPT